MEKNNTQTKISFSQYLRRLFIAPIVLMFVLAIEAITLSFLYIKTNSSLYLIISISLTGALLAAIVIYLIFLVKSIHRTFYVDLYSKSLVNYQALVNQNREIQKFTTSSSFYEFDALNDLIDQIVNEYENATITNKMASIRDIGFEYVEGELILLHLSDLGICASSGSACTSGSLDPSHVLLAIGLPHEIAHGSLRLTLSDETTKEDIDFTVAELTKIVENLRNLSPLYEDFVKEGK